MVRGATASDDARPLPPEGSPSLDDEEIARKLTDPAFFAQPGWLDLLGELRSEDPVHLVAAPRRRPYWSVTRYDDAKAVLENPTLFSSTGGTNMPIDGRDLTAEERIALGYDVQIAALDPPVHAEKLCLFNKHFTVPSAERLRETISNIIDE